MERSGGQIAINTLSNIFGTEDTFKFIIYLNWNRLHCLNIGKVIKVVFFNLLRAHIEFFFPLFYKIIALEAALQFFMMRRFANTYTVQNYPTSIASMTP